MRIQIWEVEALHEPVLVGRDVPIAPPSLVGQIHDSARQGRRALPGHEWFKVPMRVQIWEVEASHE